MNRQHHRTISILGNCCFMWYSYSCIETEDCSCAQGPPKQTHTQITHAATHLLLSPCTEHCYIKPSITELNKYCIQNSWIWSSQRFHSSVSVQHGATCGAQLRTLSLSHLSFLFLLALSKQALLLQKKQLGFLGHHFASGQFDMLRNTFGVCPAI